MVTASDLYDFVKCPHRVYLNYNGDKTKLVPISPFLNLLFERGVKHEDAVISDLDFAFPEGTKKEERFESTKALMQKGANLIYQGVLLNRSMDGIPDLLEKQPGPSALGDYYYQPIDIKSGRGYDKRTGKLREHYAIQLYHYATLLESIQNYFPPVAYIWNIHGEKVLYNLPQFQNAYEEARNKITDLISGSFTDEPASCQDCGFCQWQQHCTNWMEENQDITLVAGVGRSYKEKLAPLGIKTVTAVANWDPDEVIQVKGIGEKRAATWQRQAHAQETGQIQILEKPEIKDAPTKIYFDFEDDPTQDLVYLYGLLIGHDDGSQEYKYFLAETKEEEEDTWKDFIEFCRELKEKDFVVFHYHHHEEVVIKRLAERYPDFDEEALKAFTDNFIDLHKVVTKSVVLPTKGYGLKPISQYLKFEYTSEDAGGAQSIHWFNEFQKDPEANRSYVDKVLEYNKEDCEATKLIKEWLNRIG